MDPVQVTPFSIDVSDEAVRDLRSRLEHTRFPDEINDSDWGWGTDLGLMRTVVDHWRSTFDWRAKQAHLNTFPHFRANLGGEAVHFVHLRTQHERRVPLLLTHGWPGSFAEMLRLAPLLVDPVGSATDAAFGFDVVIPSLPGFGFSDRPRSPGASSAAAAAKFHMLMVGLGYERYAVQGGDLGAGVSLRLAKTHPESVVGAHVNFPSFVWGGPLDEGVGAAADRRREVWMRQEGAYSHQHSTRPQTLGYALNDSPAGLAAWILEKFYFWSDRQDDPGALPFDIDELLTNLSIYWFTETITSSMRIYREGAADPLVLQPDDPIRVPVAVADFPYEIQGTQPEERMAAVTDLRRWTRFDRGGHFAALEQPELLATDICEFFADLGLSWSDGRDLDPVAR